MAESVRNVNTTDFLDPYNLLQLADDTAVQAEYFLSLQKKFIKLIQYSKAQYQVPNVKKTVYPHFAKEPTSAPIEINDHTKISSIDDKEWAQESDFL